MNREINYLLINFLDITVLFGCKLNFSYSGSDGCELKNS
jgi:hypothetical protein